MGTESRVVLYTNYLGYLELIHSDIYTGSGLSYNIDRTCVFICMYFGSVDSVCYNFENCLVLQVSIMN